VKLKQFQNERIRDAGVHLFVMATGAGAGIQEKLWTAPGIGSVLVGAQFPYAMEETNDFIGHKPDRYVSEETAISQASAAYMRAKAVSGLKPALGLGLTAAAATLKPPRGGHRVYAAVVSDLGCKGAYLQLKDRDRRQWHGDLCDYLGMDLMDEVLEPGASMLSTDSYGAVVNQDISAKVAEIFWRRPVFMPTGERRRVLPWLPHKVVHFPGSFNPPHAGHHHMAAVTERQQRFPVAYTINGDHPAKGPLGPVELLARAAYFRATKYENPRPLMFTRDQALFTDKARALGVNGKLVVGADTLARMLDPQWGPRPTEVLQTFHDLGTRLYCFNRGDLRVVPIIRSLPNWEQYRKIFVGLGDAPNISSTALRGI